ncbi:MAG: cysteine desulfurase [Deltaproteobacteria bacterium]|nr:cysteine desulfurase [Deltaproteobacteria bacterium]MBW2363163.1 cysteine desulfurase [Deltaproteobacteria bacterium]
MAFNAEIARKDFPIFEEKMRGKPLVFLDSAASAQKPRAVIDAMARFYSTSYANIHRGVYELSERATGAFEGTREKARAFLNAPEAREIVFVRGTTEAINLVAATFGRTHIGADDEVLITHMEHHSNIVPWQLLCEEKGARLRVAPIDDRGALDVEAFGKLLTPRTKLAAISHVSNALGTVNPVSELVELAHAAGVPVLIDGAQAVPHQAVDVQALGCDFYAFSSHKVFGPSGVGVLWGKAEHLEAMPPYQSGGEMILTVSFEGSTWNEIPHKFEAGTPDIGGVVGLGAALDYVTGLGLDAISAHESELLAYASQALETVRGLRLIGTAPHKASVLSFVLDGIHPHDIGTILDQEGIAVRTGHHCAQPVMQRFDVPATARASLALYNTRADVDALVAGLERVRGVFAR